MGLIMKENEEIVTQTSFQNSPENYEFNIPHEYPHPCPFLTPENLGYSRPNPYPYSYSRY